MSILDFYTQIGAIGVYLNVICLIAVSTLYVIANDYFTVRCIFKLLICLLICLIPYVYISFWVCVGIYGLIEKSEDIVVYKKKK